MKSVKNLSLSLFCTYLMTTVLTTPAGAEDWAQNDRNIFWDHETEIILELVKLEKNKLAHQHLQLLRKIFPDRIEEIAYYQGYVAFYEHAYAQATECFLQALKGRLDTLRSLRVKRMLVQAYLRNGQYNEAIPIFVKLPMQGIRGGWYGSLLAETTET
ncbi:MAG: hypothetical protein D6820_02300, partial [Lentisphaerae bacterium]